MVFFKKKSEDEIAKTTPPFEASVLVEPTGGGAPRSEQPRAATEQPLAGHSTLTQPPGATTEAGFDRFGKLRSALGPGTVIQGKLSFDTPVRIDGRLSGEIFSSQAIIVGSTGSIEGDIEVSSLVVLGAVRGKVKAQRVEILQGGRLEADFTAPVLTIEEGGSFNGSASMGASTKSSAAQSVATNPGAPGQRVGPATGVGVGLEGGTPRYAPEGETVPAALNGTVQ